MKEIKQNKNTPAIRLLSFLSAFVVFVFSMSLPSFAYTDTSINGMDFTDQPIASFAGTGDAFIFNSSTPLFDLLDNGINLYSSYRGSSNSSGTLYAFCVINGRDLVPYFVISSGSPGARIISKDTSDNYSYQWKNNSDKGYNSTYDLYVLTGSMVTRAASQTFDLHIPQFSDVYAGLAAVRDWIDSPMSSGTPAPIAVTLKPGYVAYFDISDLTNVRTVLGTSLFSGSKYPGFSTTQSIGVLSSLPSGSFSLPISGTSSINWAGSGQKNLIGQYSNFSYIYTTTTVGSTRYLVVVNPLSGSMPVLTAAGASASNRNGNITVLINECRGSKIYSLTETLAVGSGTLETDSSGSSVNDGIYDDDAGAWDFTNPTTGLPQNPDDLPTGGGNDPVIGGSGGNSINEFLQDIANTIKGFFSGAIGAVTTLVSSGSDFIHSLSGLYAWLPSPVYSVLVSALILVITIGVIKVFI